MPASVPDRSEEIIRRHVLMAAGAGLIPVPLADLAAVTGIQLQMLAALSENYGIPFSRHRFKSIVSSLVGGIASREIATMGFSAMFKAIPGLGSVIGAASMPLASAALTYAIGAVFRDHFAGGGDIDSFKLDGMRTRFRERLDHGRKIAADLIASKSAPAAAPVAVAELPEPKAPAPAAEGDAGAPAAPKIYCILKPNIGKYGKVYLKTYVDGQRPEKYIGTMDEFKTRYAVENLETVKDRIIADHRELFLGFLKSRSKEHEVYESEGSHA